LLDLLLELQIKIPAI